MSFSDHRFHTCNEWMELIQECRASGLSDAAWCHQKGIPTSSFYTAVKRCRKKACEVPGRNTLVRSEVQEVVPVAFNETFTTYPIHSENHAPSTAPAIQIIVNDYKIQISGNCAKETIKNTLLALREIC